MWGVQHRAHHGATEERGRETLAVEFQNHSKTKKVTHSATEQLQGANRTLVNNKGEITSLRQWTDRETSLRFPKNERETGFRQFHTQEDFPSGSDGKESATMWETWV